MDFGQPNITTSRSTMHLEMEKPFKHTNLDHLDFQLHLLLPIVDKVDHHDSFLSEIPEELFEPNE